jgi:HEAT repeat protein
LLSKDAMERPQSAAFRRKVQIIVKKTRSEHRAEIRGMFAALVESGIRSLEDAVAVVESETSERDLRDLACWAVGRLRPRGWTATLGRVMANAPDAGLAHTAVERLVAAKSAAVVKVLHQVLLRGRSPAGRAAAAWGLGHINARSTAGSLIRVVLKRAEDSSVRVEAAEALGYLRDRRAVPPLLKLLGDPNPQIRYEAIFSLGNLGDRRALPALDTLLDDATDVPKRGSLGAAAAEAKDTIEMLNPTRSPKTDRGARAPSRARKASRPKRRSS